MGDLIHNRVFRTQEDWDPEYWSDIQSESDSDTERNQRGLNAVLARGMLTRPYFNDSWDTLQKCSLESCSFSTASTSNDSCESAEGPEFQSEVGLALQQHLPKAKKTFRPGKSERERFRKFVDELKAKIRDDGANFNFETFVLPHAFNKKLSTRDKIRDILNAHHRSLLGQSN